MDPYKVLEIERGSTKKQIKAAYRKLSRATHPDLNPDIPDIEFKLVNWAYRKITNPGKAGQCPYQEPKIKVKPKPPEGTSWKKREAKRKKVRREPPPPNWGSRKDPTLKYYKSGPDGYYDEQRDYLFTEAPPPPPRRRKARRTEHRASEPRRACASVEDILDDAPQSDWQKKWAKRMKERRN